MIAVPTTIRRPRGVQDDSRSGVAQVDTLDANAREQGLDLLRSAMSRRGIVHVIGPEQGATLPGMTVVCGDSRTSTHGAFAALAFGIGTSEVEHVMATQCLPQKRSIAAGALRPPFAGGRDREGSGARHHRQRLARRAAPATPWSSAAGGALVVDGSHA